MAWARFRGRDSLYRLTDGYVEAAKTAGQQGSEAAGFEEQMAANIFRLANRPYRSYDLPGNQPPDPLGIWVLGRLGWVGSEVAEPVRSILEDEVDPNYRIIITREGVAERSDAPVPDWSGWIYFNGMRKKKRHANVAAFKSVGDTLLGMIHDYDLDPETSTAQLLEALEIPFAYARRSGASRDGVPSKRTQQ